MIVTDLSPNPAKASQQITTTAANLGGFAFREVTGKASAVVIIRDGTSSAGKEIEPISLNPSESTRELYWFGSEGPRGIPITTGGIYLEVVSGEIEGMVIWE
jgi:hypothetical protein